MKAFFIVFGACLAIVVGVYFYAQTKSGEVKYYSLQEMMQESTGKVLGEKTTIKTQEKFKPLPLRIEINKKKVYLWWTQKITIHTKPGAEVRVEVTYPSGSKNNEGSRTGIANYSGDVTYSWSVRGYKNYGTAKVNVVVSKGNRKAEGNEKFKIIRYR